MAKASRTAPRGELPDVDERLVMPGSGIEILEGRVLKVPGADPPHATEHAQLAYVLRAHAAPGFVAVVDPHERSGGRRLEVLAFEVVASQRLGSPTKKARELSRRGVLLGERRWPGLRGR